MKYIYYILNSYTIKLWLNINFKLNNKMWYSKITNYELKLISIFLIMWLTLPGQSQEWFWHIAEYCPLTSSVRNRSPAIPKQTSTHISNLFNKYVKNDY